VAAVIGFPESTLVFIPSSLIASLCARSAASLKPGEAEFFASGDGRRLANAAHLYHARSWDEVRAAQLTIEI